MTLLIIVNKKHICNVALINVISNVFISFAIVIALICSEIIILNYIIKLITSSPKAWMEVIMEINRVLTSANCCETCRVCESKLSNAIFVQSKRFCSWTRQNGTKFDLDWEIELKKSFELDRQILENVLTKVALNFIHFAWHGQNWAKFCEDLMIFSCQFRQI